jgi:hypothetical protein
MQVQQPTVIFALTRIPLLGERKKITKQTKIDGKHENRGTFSLFCYLCFPAKTGFAAGNLI